MKLALGVLVFTTIFNVTTLFADTMKEGGSSSDNNDFRIACVRFDETLLTATEAPDMQGDWNLISGPITVYDVNGDVNNQAIAKQISRIMKDYGLNSHCANVRADGTPEFSYPSYESFLKEGEFPTGTSSSDGSCTAFDPQNLTVRQTDQSGGSFGVNETLSELVDPISGVSVYSTYGETYAAFKQFLIQGHASRICSIRLYQPQDIYQNRAFSYFTKN